MVTNRDDSSSGSGVQERVLSVLLNEMDGIGPSIDNFEVRKILAKNLSLSSERVSNNSGLQLRLKILRTKKLLSRI